MSTVCSYTPEVCYKKQPKWCFLYRPFNTLDVLYCGQNSNYKRQILLKIYINLFIKILQLTQSAICRIEVISLKQFTQLQSILDHFVTTKNNLITSSRVSFLLVHILGLGKIA